MFLLAATAAWPCELCAIYSADNARGGFSPGPLFTLGEMYMSAHTLQAEGEPFSIPSFPLFNQAYVDSSITHLVPGYDFSSRLGVSLNIPIIYRSFRRTGLRTAFTNPQDQILDETGAITGLGDLALVSRVGLLQNIGMKYSYALNLLAGVKFPTGDTARLDSEIESAELARTLFGGQTAFPHELIGGVHQHDLTLGSGSYDGVFGLTWSCRWQRWLLNLQGQYYLRTEAHSYQFGDEIIVSGGPGAYVLLGRQFTLSLQANAFYESTARDTILGQVSNQTGTTAWFMGPLINLTAGEHFSAYAGADLPLRIYNYGLQTVVDYRIHGGLTWRF